jgi:hypothetical protein
MACHRAVPVQKGDPLSHLHLLGRWGMSLCHHTLPSMRVITRTMGEPIHHIPRLPTGVYGRLRAPDHHPCTRRSAAGSSHTPRHQDFRAAHERALGPVSPSMERCVMARLVWPASSCTRRRLPTCETLRAAQVMKVAPGCDERRIFRR